LSSLPNNINTYFIIFEATEFVSFVLFAGFFNLEYDTAPMINEFIIKNTGVVRVYKVAAVTYSEAVKKLRGLNLPLVGEISAIVKTNSGAHPSSYGTVSLRASGKTTHSIYVPRSRTIHSPIRLHGVVLR
jgi:hypothetical protein